MTKPDLSDPEPRRAYRVELRRAYWPWRYGALAVLLIALIGSVADPAHQRMWEILMVIGAFLTLAVIVARARYHQRRMRD